MRLKLDENLSRHLKPVLSGLGHDVLTAADEGLLSRPDAEVAAAAIQEERMLLTLDSDFVRSTDLDQLSSCIAVVDPVRVRVRSPRAQP